MTGRKIIRIAAVTAAILASSASPVLGQPQETEQTLEQPEEPVQTPGQPEEAVQPRPAEGWQLDASQQWIYMENSKKLTSRWLPWPDGTLR